MNPVQNSSCTMLYGMGYPLGLFKSAVLVLFPPQILGPWLWTTLLSSNCKHQCIFSMVFPWNQDIAPYFEDNCSVPAKTPNLSWCFLCTMSIIAFQQSPLSSPGISFSFSSQKDLNTCRLNDLRYWKMKFKEENAFGTLVALTFWQVVNLSLRRHSV